MAEFESRPSSSEWEVLLQRMSHHRIRRTGLLHRHPGRQSPLYRISLLRGCMIGGVIVRNILDVIHVEVGPRIGRIWRSVLEIFLHDHDDH